MQPKPKVVNFNACLVGMKTYSNSKTKEFGKLDNLEESHSDVEKLRKLFVDTLKWDPSDVHVYRDLPLHIPQLFEKI